MAPVSKLSDSDVALQAAIDGDLRLLKKMARKANLREAKDGVGRNALHFAAGKGHLEVCRFLVEELGLDANSAASAGGTPVHFVAVGGHERVLGYLLDRGGDPGVPDAKGSTPLHDAAEQEHCVAVRLLLSKGVDVDPVNYRGTPLHLAAAKDSDHVVKILREHGADLNKVVNHVFSPLMMACCGHSLKCMKLLVQAGADVNFISSSGPSILMEAVDDGLTDIVKFLLEAGADPNIANEDGKLPIMFAAVHGHRELVEILLPKTRPIPYVPDWSVDGIIRCMKYLRFGVQDAALVGKRIADAKSQGKEAFAKGEYLAAIYFYCLLEMAKKVNLREAKDVEGRNALHLAAARGNLVICRFLVEESGLDVNSASADGKSPVLLAAAGGDRGVLEYLLGRGGDPRMTDARGSTPLHDAAERGHCEAVRLLLSKGVEVDPLGQRGTPLHLAAAWGHDQAVKVLLEHGADPNRIVHHTLSPLMMACCARSLKCMKLLVEAGADVNLRNSYSPTVLVRAVDEGLTDIVKFLLEAGADPNIYEEVHGRIPIMIAAALEHRELVEILFTQTKPIASLPNWSVDGIIDTMKCLPLKAQDAGLTDGQIADAKSRGNAAFKKGDYLSAIYLYGVAREKDPHDATLFANRSLCWLRLGDVEHALFDARHCRRMRPRWSKVWYREGAALSLLKDYEGAIDAFTEALKLEPANDEIEKALREATDALRNAGCAGEQNP